MRTNTALPGPQTKGPDEVLKVTALLYLREALIGQQFEACPELIASAKQFGAGPQEITEVIAGYLKEGP